MDMECSECDALFVAAEVRQVLVLEGEAGKTPQMFFVCPICGHRIHKDKK